MTSPITRIAITVLAGGLVLLLAYYFGVVVRSGEIGQKGPWSVLQRVEADHRGDIPATVPILLKNVIGSGYTVLGLPSASQQYPRVWLILNDSGAGNPVKQLPGDVRFSIMCSYLSGIQRSMQINHNVLAYLQSRCS